MVIIDRVLKPYLFFEKKKKHLLKKVSFKEIPNWDKKNKEKGREGHSMKEYDWLLFNEVTHQHGLGFHGDAASKGEHWANL